MKKGLKALVAFVAAAALLASMSVVAFAANYETVTTYAGNGKVSVTTTVTGVAENEQVAYLVKNGDSIVWVDQKAAEGTGASFTFTTDALNAAGLGSTIQVGTTSIADGSFEAIKQNKVQFDGFNVTWSTDGNGMVYAFVGGVASADKATSTKAYGEVTFVIAPNAGYVLDTIKKGGESVGATIGSTRTFAVDAATNFEFTFKAAEITQASATTTETDIAAENGVVLINGTAIGTEFGVLASLENADKLDTLTAAEISAMTNNVSKGGVVKFSALGANEDGKFIIRLADTEGNTFIEGKTYTGCIYAIYNGNVDKSSTFTFGVVTE